MVEDLWESVLQQECGPKLVALLKQLRDLCSPEGQATNEQASEVFRLISQLDLNEAIRAARAFALYFQLINIVEQHYEQREQLSRLLSHITPPQKPTVLSNQVAQQLEEEVSAGGGPGADMLEKSWQAKAEQEVSQGTFHTLFPIYTK